MLHQLVLKNRSTRRFNESMAVAGHHIENWIDLSRLCASARNAQPLKYMYSNKSEINDMIFPWLQWAGYLEDWDGPDKGERPSAYILVMGDTSISNNFECDAGIAMQTITLAAVENGFAACIIGSLNRRDLQQALRLPPEYKILYVIALGIPGEEIKVEKTTNKGDIRYWRDKEGVHHVPKRPLDEILHLAGNG